MSDETDNVSLFPGITPLPFEPNVMLDAAKKAGLTKVVILGECEDGRFFFSASVSDSPNVLWFLRKAEHELMRVEREMAES